MHPFIIILLVLAVVTTQALDIASNPNVFCICDAAEVAQLLNLSETKAPASAETTFNNKVDVAGDTFTGDVNVPSMLLSEPPSRPGSITSSVFYYYNLRSGSVLMDNNWRSLVTTNEDGCFSATFDGPETSNPPITRVISPSIDTFTLPVAGDYLVRLTFHVNNIGVDDAAIFFQLFENGAFTGSWTLSNFEGLYDNAVDISMVFTVAAPGNTIAIRQRASQATDRCAMHHSLSIQLLD